jgi:hypothetical protein
LAEDVESLLARVFPGANAVAQGGDSLELLRVVAKLAEQLHGLAEVGEILFVLLIALELRLVPLVDSVHGLLIELLARLQELYMSHALLFRGVAVRKQHFFPELKNPSSSR